jgi:hypothetical protein
MSGVNGVSKVMETVQGAFEREASELDMIN